MSLNVKNDEQINDFLAMITDEVTEEFLDNIVAQIVVFARKLKRNKVTSTTQGYCFQLNVAFYYIFKKKKSKKVFENQNQIKLSYTC